MVRMSMVFMRVSSSLLAIHPVTAPGRHCRATRLCRVEDVARIERLLDGAHEIKCDRILIMREFIALD